MDHGPLKSTIIVLFVNVLLLHCVSVDSTSKTGKSKLYLLALTPFHTQEYENRGWNGGPGIVPAARLAVQQINNRTDILPNNELALIEQDTGCHDSPEAMARLVTGYAEQVIYSGDNVVGIVGPACSVNTLFLGKLSQPARNPLVQVTIATSPRLEDRTEYPFTFATLSSGNQFSRALLTLIRQEGWGKVVTIVDGLSSYYKDVYNSFHESVMSIGSTVEIEHFEVYGSVSYFPFDDIIKSRVRIVIVFGNHNVADQLICGAHRNTPKLTYPTIQWLFVERSDFINSNSGVECDDQELIKAFEKAVFLQYQLETTDLQEPLVSGQTSAELEQDYIKAVDEYSHETGLNVSGEYSHGMRYAPVFYDAVWTFGKSLDNLFKSQDALNLSKPRPLGGKDNLEVAEALRRHIFTLPPFRGASGTIKFDNTTGQTSTLIKFQQEHNGQLVLIGYSENSYINGTFIKDSFDIQFDGIHGAVMALTLICVALLLVLTVTFHALNIRYSSHNVIKATSPRLNHFIFIGIYMLLFGMTLLTLIRGVYFEQEIWGHVLCNVYTWLVDIGVTIIVATVFIKTFRIYRIFVHFQTPGGLFLRDSFLGLCIFALVLPVVLPSLISSSNGLVEWKYQEVPYEIPGQKYDIHVRTMCSVPIWQEVYSRLYFGILLFISLMLSLPIRRINPRFKTIKSISVLSFCLTFITWAGYPLYVIALNENWNQHATFFIITAMLVGVLLTCLLLLFAPPITSILTEKWKKDKWKQYKFCFTNKVICVNHIR